MGIQAAPTVQEVLEGAAGGVIASNKGGSAPKNTTGAQHSDKRCRNKELSNAIETQQRINTDINQRTQETRDGDITQEKQED